MEGRKRGSGVLLCTGVSRRVALYIWVVHTSPSEESEDNNREGEGNESMLRVYSGLASCYSMCANWWECESAR
jgi:hypothetical protein